MTMLPRPPSAALLRKLAYTQSAQYTHPPLFSLFRPASTPRTEVLDDQLPHQSDGTLMRGPAGRAAVVLGRHPPLGEENASPASSLPKIPLITTRQGRRHVSHRRIDARRTARLAESRRHCSALRAAQGLPNGDPARSQQVRLFSRLPATTWRRSGLVTSRVTLGTSLNALTTLSARRCC